MLKSYTVINPQYEDYKKFLKNILWDEICLARIKRKIVNLL